MILTLIMIVYVSIMSLINGLSSDEWGQLLVTVMFFYLIIYCVIAYQNEHIINMGRAFGGKGPFLLRKTDSPSDYWFDLILMSSLAVAVNIDIWFFKDPSFVSLLLNQNK